MSTFSQLSIFIADFTTVRNDYSKGVIESEKQKEACRFLATVAHSFTVYY